MTKHCCKQMDYLLDEGKISVVYIASYRKYSMQVNRLKFEKIEYCPWCGSKFPNSLQNIYFESLKQFGIYDPVREMDKIPNEFKDDTWWRSGKYGEFL